MAEEESDSSSLQAEAESHTVCVLVSNVPLGYAHYDVTKCLQDAAPSTTTISDARVVPTQKPGNATPHSVNHAIITVNTSDTEGIPESLKLEEGIPAADPLVTPMFQEKATASFKIPTPIEEKVVLQNIQSQGKKMSLEIKINSDSIKVRGSCSQVAKFREYLVKRLTEYHLRLPQHEVSQHSTLIPQENSQPHEHSTPHPPNEPTEGGGAAGYSPEESKVFAGLSKDVLLLMSKVNEGRFKMMQFFPEEGKVVVLATSEEESEKCISQFQETYQGIIKNRQLKSGNLEIPASFHMDDMFSLLDEFNDKYNQCHFLCDEKARVIRIVSMSSRQFDQAKKLISDRLAGEKFEDKNSKEKGGKSGKGASEKMSTKKGSSEVLVISKGRKLTVKRSNLVDEDVDAIVNAANGQLKHIGGVAKALDKASQGELQKASDNYVRSYREIPVGGVAVTSAGGKLKCKRVIHAVGPIASPNTPELACSQLIYQAISNSLYEAQKMKAASIAFPALSTGIFAVDKSLAANAIFQAILKFHYTSNDVLKDIRIVIIDEETYTVFAQHLLATKATGSSAAQAAGTDSSYLITGTTNPNKSSHNHPSSSHSHSSGAGAGIWSNAPHGNHPSSEGGIWSNAPHGNHPSSGGGIWSNAPHGNHPSSGGGIWSDAPHGNHPSSGGGILSNAPHGNHPSSGGVGNKSSGSHNIGYGTGAWTGGPTVSSASGSHAAGSGTPWVGSVTRTNSWPKDSTSISYSSPPPGFSASSDSHGAVVTSQPTTHSNIIYPTLPPPHAVASTGGSETEAINQSGGGLVGEGHQQQLSADNNILSPEIVIDLANKGGTSPQEDRFSTPTGSPPITPPHDSKKIATGDVGMVNESNIVAHHLFFLGCPICRNEKATDPTTTKCCQQIFCKSCLKESLKHSSYCPTCKKPLKAVKGNQPAGGTMTHSVLQSTSLPGYEGAGTIVITYNIPGGTQTAEHPNPGKPYHNTSRKAYLPNTREGQEILKLLKKAFDARLIFTIGTSHTTGVSNSIVWNDIHHKTYVHGQPFGYPDPTYLARVREELKAKGIE